MFRTDFTRIFCTDFTQSCFPQIFTDFPADFRRARSAWHREAAKHAAGLFSVFGPAKCPLRKSV